MANMSYCRFENTYKDMLNCYQALMDNDVQDLSKSELKYAVRMMELCESILEYRDDVEDAKN